MTSARYYEFDSFKKLEDGCVDILYMRTVHDVHRRYFSEYVFLFF